MLAIDKTPSPPHTPLPRLIFSAPGGGEPAGERHRGDREQEPAAADADQPVSEPADAERQPPDHVPQRGGGRRRQRGSGPLPGGREGQGGTGGVLDGGTDGWINRWCVWIELWMGERLMEGDVHK